MSTLTVTTQAELDAALADPSVDWIDIDSPRGVWIDVVSYGSATVRAYGSATVSAYGSATVRASGSATVRAYGSATVRAYDSATVRAYGSATVRAYGSATVSAYGSATVSAYGSATVRASGSATVRAYGSATVRAYDSATVRAYDSATVRAGKHTAVHLHSGRARVEGGVLIDHSSLDLTDPAAWCDYHGVTIDDGHATVYKAVRADLESGHGFAYPIGETVTCDDWKPNGQCGNGLHFSPSPTHAFAYDDLATRFLECRIPLAEMRPLLDGGTAKCKSRSAVVVREVDEHVRPVAAKVEAAS